MLQNTSLVHTLAALQPNIANVLWTTAARRADHPAIVERERSTTYGELQRLAAAVAARLTAEGLQPGDRVGIFLERGPEAAACFYGILAAGGVAINVNETLRPRQIEYVLQHAGARALISTQEKLDRLPRAVDSEAKILEVQSIEPGAEFTPVPRFAPDVAQIIYTSGSTGMPKGVTVTHGNLFAGTNAVVSYVEVTEDDRIASLLPFSFDYGFNQLLCAVATGATLVVERSPVPQQIVTTLREQAVTVLPCVPPLWLQLLGVPDFTETPITSLRAMTNTGGRVPVEAVRKLRRAHPDAKLFLMYGLTEAFRATYLPPEQADVRPDSIGKAIPGCEIFVLREDGTLCAPGETGELVQRGATVTLGYWRDEELTAKVFRPNPLRPAGTPPSERVVYSGDLVRIDEEGFLYHVGRRDKMIKTLGFRVSPDEVCEALYASGQILEAIVVPEEDEQRGSRIIAFVTLTAQGSLHQLKAFCRTELPRYMQPGRIEVLDALPRLPSGKHDLGALVGK